MPDRENVWLEVFLDHFHLSRFNSFQEGGCLCLPLNERDYLRTGNKTKWQERSSCYNQTDDDSAPIKENEEIPITCHPASASGIQCVLSAEA